MDLQAYKRGRARRPPVGGVVLVIAWWLLLFGAWMLLVDVLVAVGGLAVLTTYDPLRQALMVGIYGLLLALLFFVLQAPDVGALADRGLHGRGAGDDPAGPGEDPRPRAGGSARGQ